MVSTDIIEFRKAYAVAFTDPFAAHVWRSVRGRSCWVDLEGWQDSMAGPLFSVANTGGCEYVYSRNDCYFTDVTGPTALRRRLLKSHAGLLGGIDQFSPTTSEEREDLDFMRSVAEQMRVLIEWACDLEQLRRSTERRRP